MVQSTKILGGSNMLIDKVLFRYGDVTEIITLESIEQHRDYILLIEHLYCATPNCRCKMMYIPEGKRIAHFKKWIGGQHQHSKHCPYYYEPAILDRQKKMVETSVAILNDKHISGVLKNALNKFLETEEERQLRLEKGRTRARSQRNSFINKIEGIFPISIFVNKLTTGNKGQRLVEGGKTPYVKTRGSIVSFRNGDIGETQATAGYFKRIIYKEETIEMIITDQQKLHSFHLYFEEVFFANSGVGVRRMLEELEDVLKTVDDVVITCIGEIVKKDGRFGMRVMRASNIRINGDLIPTFIFEMDSLFNYTN